MMEQQNSDASLGAVPPSESVLGDMKQEAARLVQVSSTSFGVVSDLGKLAATEVLLTIKTLPKLLGLALILLPVAFLTWIAFSALIAYLFKMMLDSALAGFATFFICQILLLTGCLMLVKRYQRLLGIPRTKVQAKAVFETMKNEFTG